MTDKPRNTTDLTGCCELIIALPQYALVCAVLWALWRLISWLKGVL